MTTSQLYRDALDADAAWSAELHRLFGANAGDVRYTSKGEGTPDSTLRALYDRFCLTRDQWLRAIADEAPCICGSPEHENGACLV